MYHFPGTTPEAPTLQAAFGSKKPRSSDQYGKAERKLAYDNLNSSAQHRRRFRHARLPAQFDRAGVACRRKLRARSSRPTPSSGSLRRALRDAAELNGYGKMIRDAGAHLMSDTCPAIGRVMPKGTMVVATDSAKQAHYLPAIMESQTWFGSVEDCVSAALTGKWRGSLS